MFSDSSSDDDAVLKQFNENAKYIYPEVDDDSDDEKCPVPIIYKKPVNAIVDLALKLRRAQKENDDWMKILKTCPDAYQCIPNPTYEMAKLVVETNPRMFYLVDKKLQTHELCTIAVEGHSCNISNVQNQTVELAKKAIKKEPRTIQFIKEQTEELCMTAVRADPKCFEYCKVKTPAMFFHMFDKATVGEVTVGEVAAMVKYGSFPKR